MASIRLVRRTLQRRSSLVSIWTSIEEVPLKGDTVVSIFSRVPFFPFFVFCFLLEGGGGKFHLKNILVKDWYAKDDSVLTRQVDLH